MRQIKARPRGSEKKRIETAASLCGSIISHRNKLFLKLSHALVDFYYVNYRWSMSAEPLLRTQLFPPLQHISRRLSLNLFWSVFQELRL